MTGRSWREKLHLTPQIIKSWTLRSPGRGPGNEAAFQVITQPPKPGKNKTATGLGTSSPNDNTRNVTMNLSRREFIRTSIVAGSAAKLFGAPFLESGPPGERTPDWVDKPMRWAQLTLVEDDPGKFDLDFWLGYFKRTRSDAVCLSAGGCVAFYPTNVPFHHRSQWLADTDPFGALVDGCRRLGMVVIARTDPHATYDDVAEAHPDWIAVDVSGNRRRHWASREMWVTCALGPYNFDFMTEVKKEITSRYDIDGIFINRWDGSGNCYCEHCQKNFRAASGFEIPRRIDPQVNEGRAFLLWRQDRLFELWQQWDTAIRKIKPHARVIPNTGGGALSSLDMERIGQIAPTLMADRQARRGLTAPWANGKNGKEFRAVMGAKPIVGIFSVGVEEPYRWKDSVQNDAEILLWAADGVANGLRPWFTKFGAVLRDERWLAVVEKMYRRYASWEKYLRNERSLATVGLVYSQQSAWFYGAGNAREKVEDPALGWYQALIEARVPFEMVHDRLLDPGKLRALKTLILPNIAALSQRQCQQLTDFVKNGGGLIATYETSLYDEWGERRDTFGLANLFGAAYVEHTPGPLQNSYLRLDHSTRHPLLRGLENAPRIINGTRRLEVRETAPLVSKPITLIPSYPDLPMEKVFPRAGPTNKPEVFFREFGRGRVVYFPWDIDRTFWEVLSVDHLTLMHNAVDWAGSEEPVLRVTGPGVLDVTFWKQSNSITVHLINLTNPMMMKGPIRELIPIGEQRVRLRLPEGSRARRARLLAAEKSTSIRRDGDHLEIAVPSILDHEVVAIDLAT